MARLPPPRYAVHRGLRVPDRRAGGDSPLRTASLPEVREACPSRRLSTPRSRPCGLNATFPIQSRPCTAISSSRSHEACRAVQPAHAPSRARPQMASDAVRLAEYTPPMLYEHGSFAGSYLGSKSPIHFPDFTAEIRRAGEGDRAAMYVAEAGFRTDLVLPMLRNDELIGSLTIRRQRVE